MAYKILRKYCILIVYLTIVLFTDAAVAGSSQPTSQMQNTVEGIIQLLNDDELKKTDKHDERRNRIISLVEKRFNFKLMSKLALGKSWKERTEDEKNGFSDLFSDLLKNTYIRRVENYSDERVVFGKQDVKNNLARVQSKFYKNDTSISIVYKMKKDGDEWLVFDVIIEGASIIKQFRRQFSVILKEEKFQGLILRLEEKVKKIST